jgi:CRISPR-associated protein Cas2
MIKLNRYKIMWLFVMFDLPTDTEAQRKKANQFRKLLIKSGFTMFQYSIYIRHCLSRKYADVHIKRVQKWTPSGGRVDILMVTDKQVGNIITIEKETSELKVSRNKPEKTDQLELF